MIDFDFEYYCPRSIKKKAQKIIVSNKEKRKMFAGGATEFISRARMHELNPEILIDLKGIPDCNTLMEQENKLIIGSAVSLNQIVDSNPFPLLTEVCRAIGNRTARNKITIGGNILSSLPYKEAILPFLLADSEAVIATSDGIEQRKINALSPLSDSEMLIQLHVDQKYAQAPYQYKRKTKQSNINYPIVTAMLCYWRMTGVTRLGGVVAVRSCEEELNRRY